MTTVLVDPAIKRELYGDWKCASTSSLYEDVEVDENSTRENVIMRIDAVQGECRRRNGQKCDLECPVARLRERI